MLEKVGNIWERHLAGHWIIIPTNGTLNSTGHAVMGKGLALELKQRYTLIPTILGDEIRRHGNNVYFFPVYKVICFPTKDHYEDDSKVTLIEKGARQLADAFELFDGPFYLPRLGCGEGNLDWERHVRPILSAWLDDKYIVLTKE
jgi:hypothetical protein